MRKILTGIFGIVLGLLVQSVYAADVFEILPDLPESLSNAAQASSVSTVESATAVTQAVGHEPNLVSMVCSLVFVILLIYATGILYSKLNNFGAKALKRKDDGAQISVISTTPLGANKTLHVVELDGKRMLIGASTNAIHLIKDLGHYPPSDIEEASFSKIEIPNIRIPKIEIPRIEIPGFTRVVSKKETVEENIEKEDTKEKDDNSFQFSEIYEEENSEGIIDELFKTSTEKPMEEVCSDDNNEHKVDPDEFALYKKYL